MNPRGRNGRFLKRKRHVNARRRRRRNPIAALNPRHRRRRRRNPIAALNPRRRRRRNPIAAFAANPRRRRRRNPRASRRRYRRNPGGGLSMRGLMGTLKQSVGPAIVGGVGAVGVDIALGYIPLPEWFETATGKMVARIGGALALGLLANMVASRRVAMNVTLGALTVSAYGSIRDFTHQTFPQLPGLAGISPPMYGDFSDTRLGYLDPAPRLGAYMQRRAPAGNGVGAYMRDTLDNVNGLAGVTSDGL